MTNIGNNIRRARIAAQMTQEELATKMGYKSKSTINKIELGKNDIPQSKIKQFAEVLNTSISYLMGWEEKIEEDPVATANKLADLFLDIEIQEHDTDIQKLIEGYKKLDTNNKKHLLAYISFLTKKGRD